jgi:hypothetical protein
MNSIGVIPLRVRKRYELAGRRPLSRSGFVSSYPKMWDAEVRSHSQCWARRLFIKKHELSPETPSTCPGCVLATHRTPWNGGARCVSGRAPAPIKTWDAQWVSRPVPPLRSRSALRMRSTISCATVTFSRNERSRSPEYAVLRCECGTKGYALTRLHEFL